MVIVLAGKKLAGKGTIAQHLHDRKDAQIFRFSQTLSDILERLHKENSRSNLVALGGALRTAFTDDILAETLLEDLKFSPSSLNVVDGMRYVAEYDLLKALPHFKLVYIEASVETRFERTRGRVEKVDEAAMSFEEFKTREDDVTEREIDMLKDKADFVIDNVATIEEFFTDFEATVLKI